MSADSTPLPPPAEFADAILRALSGAPQGLSRRELQRRVPLGGVSDATLLRWLGALVDEGRVRARGRTRARRYWAIEAPPIELTPIPVFDAPLAFSPESEALLHQLRAPVAAREPAGFDRDFLDAYRPGETYYLPEALRQRLALLGRTRVAPQPGGTYARQILERLLIDLSWNSSRLEGNTYSLLDTERLFREGAAAHGKEAAERQMILNHKQAIEWLVEGVADAPPLRLDVRMLRGLHAQLAHNLLGDPVDEGRVRARPVLIAGSTFIPLDVPQLIEECLTQVIRTAAAIDDPFEQAFFLLVHVPYLQPFVDANKRTARLAANFPFIRDNLRPLTFVDVPRDALIHAHLAVYERRRVDLLRDVFVWAYERSSARYATVQRGLGEPDPFRLVHRALIKETMAALVRAGVGEDALEAAIEPFAGRLPAAERPRFFAVIESELRALHDGNFVRFGLRLSEYEAWAAATRGG